MISQTPSKVAPLSQSTTLRLSGKVIPNRLYRTLLSEYTSTYDENNIDTGKPLPRYAEFYQELADGGAGLICFGNIPIDRNNLENYNNAVLDSQNPRVARALFEQNIRKADLLSKHEIKELIGKYVWAAETVAKAGADGIILHASHGYIINQFLSPKLDRRIDQNRARFVLELVNAVKARLPSDKFVIAARFNCQDFIDGGQSFVERCVVAKWLEDAGVDFFDISGGTYATLAWRGNIMKELAERPSQKDRGSYFVEWAQELKKVLSRAVIGTTGGWRDSHRMAEAVANGDVDMYGLGRPLREDASFVQKILRGKTRFARVEGEQKDSKL